MASGAAPAALSDAAAQRELESEEARKRKESAALQAYLREAEQGSDAIRCPVCNTSGKFRKDMVLFTSEKCGHEMCDDCLRRRYEARATAPCQQPGCGQKLRKSDYREKRFVSGSMHHEMAVRDELSKVYCMTRGDFDSDGDWDTYLEEVESVVFDRVHGDAAAQAAARDKVEAYKRKYVNVIEARQREARYARQERRNAIRGELKATEERRHAHNLQRARERAETKRDKDRLKAQLLRTTDREQIKRILEQLRALKEAKRAAVLAGPAALGDADADVGHADDDDAAMDVDGMHAPGAGGTGRAIPPHDGAGEAEAHPLYVYSPIAALGATGGPVAPPTPALASRVASLSLCGGEGVTGAPYASAAGHRPKDVAKRALQDAFSCLFT